MDMSISGKKEREKRLANFISRRRGRGGGCQKGT